MTILLTGASGQLGWDLLKLANERNLAILGLDRRQLDITDPAEISRTIDHLKPRLIINAAAYTAVDRAEQEPELAFAVNRDAVGYLAEACLQQRIPLFHVSTDYVFDGTKGSPYTVRDTPNPINIYGRSKFAGEELLRSLLPRHFIVRTSWVFGRHGNNFVKTVLRLASGGGPLRIVNDQHGAPTSSRSLAAYILNMANHYLNHDELQQGELSWGTYHFTGQPYATWYDFAQEIIEQAARLDLVKSTPIIPIATDELQLPARRPMDSRLASLRLGSIPRWDALDWRSELQELLQSLTEADSSLRLIASRLRTPETRARPTS